MNKAFKCLATIFLSGLFLLLTGGLVTTLDEFVRVPFYLTLPVAAGLVNTAVLILFWRSKSPAKVTSRHRSRLAIGIHALLRSATARLPKLNWRQETRVSIPVTLPGLDPAQSRKISAAVAKIHSVAWWLPVSARSVSADSGGNDRS